MRPTRPRITLVVARARNGVIGRDNALPWHLPEELQHFKALTMGHAIVMGRLTWESISRVLPGRRMIVVSSGSPELPPGVIGVHGMDEAIEAAGEDDEVFVIGGARLFEAALPMADRIVLTEVEVDADGDTWFRWQPDARWRMASERCCDSRSGVRYRIQDWHCVRADAAHG